MSPRKSAYFKCSPLLQCNLNEGLPARRWHRLFVMSTVFLLFFSSRKLYQIFTQWPISTFKGCLIVCKFRRLWVVYSRFIHYPYLIFRVSANPKIHVNAHISNIHWISILWSCSFRPQNEKQTPTSWPIRQAWSWMSCIIFITACDWELTT